MAPSKSAPQQVTPHVAGDKTSSVEASTAVEASATRLTNVTEMALLILGVGCGLTLAATGVAFHMRGELGFGLPKAFSGLENPTLPMSLFLSTSMKPDSIFSDEPKKLHSQEPLPVVLASAGNSITTVVRHTLSGSKPTRRKGLLSWGATYAQAVPPDSLPTPHDIAPPVTTIAPSIASEGSAPGLAVVAPPPWMDSGSRIEELQNWFGKGQLAFELSFGDSKTWSLFKPALVALAMFTLVGLSLVLKATVKSGNNSEVSNDMKRVGASTKLPRSRGIPTEDDIIDAFDAFDHRRLGFIDRATVNHMLGHMALPGHLDAATPFLGSLKQLFYDDFRQLAQQPGPFADAVVERVSKRQQRTVSASRRATAFDERCKLGFDVDAAQVAMSTLSAMSRSALEPSTSALKDATYGGRRSWAELRAELAPKHMPEV